MRLIAINSLTVLNFRYKPIINCLVRHAFISGLFQHHKKTFSSYSVSLLKFSTAVAQQHECWSKMQSWMVQVLISCKNISLPLHFRHEQPALVALTCSHLHGPCQKGIGQKPRLAWSLHHDRWLSIQPLISMAISCILVVGESWRERNRRREKVWRRRFSN